MLNTIIRHWSKNTPNFHDSICWLFSMHMTSCLHDTNTIIIGFRFHLWLTQSVKQNFFLLYFLNIWLIGQQSGSGGIRSVICSNSSSRPLLHSGPIIDNLNILPCSIIPQLLNRSCSLITSLFPDLFSSSLRYRLHNGLLAARLPRISRVSLQRPHVFLSFKNIALCITTTLSWLLLNYRIHRL